MKTSVKNSQNAKQSVVNLIIRLCVNELEAKEQEARKGTHNKFMYIPDPAYNRVDKLWSSINSYMNYERPKQKTRR